MVQTSSYSASRGAFERVCRAAFKTLEKSPGPSVVEALDGVQLAADRVISALVVQLRSEGATWEDVGDCFGISRQAAWQRFGGSGS